MEDTGLRDTIAGALATIALTLAGILTHLRRRVRKAEAGSVAAPPPNGNGWSDQARAIGEANKALILGYQERVTHLEQQNKELMAEKEEMAERIMKQSDELSELRASVKILESQVAGLLRQVAELQRRV